MNSRHLLETIQTYRQTWLLGCQPEAMPEAHHEDHILEYFQILINSSSDCFSRSTQPITGAAAGHITGSAMVVSPDLSQVLLTLHAKLGKWLQLGGHADGEANVSRVAMREAQEESGLSELGFLRYEQLFSQGLTGFDPLPFDFDIHAIPARQAEPAHAHYDVRYLIVADPCQPLAISDESQDLKWFSLEAARKLTQAEPSMQRQFDKIAWLRRQLRLTGGESALQ